MGLREDAYSYVDQAVASIGFERQAQGIYVNHVSEDVAWWLSVSISRDKASGVYEAMANIGVRHCQLHALVSEITGSAWLNPTFATLLGHLMPQETASVVWEFAPANGEIWRDQAESLVDHVIQYGIPWMESSITLPDFLEGVLKFGIPPYRPVFVPAIQFLMKEHAQAHRTLTNELAALGERQDEAAWDYRQFAAALNRKLDPSMY